MNVIEISKRYQKKPPSAIPYKGKLGSQTSICQGRYISFVGLSGSGKSSMVDSIIMDAFDWWKANNKPFPLKIIKRQMERKLEDEKAKFLCRKIYIEHGIKISIPTFYNMPEKDRDLTDEDYRLMNLYNDYFEEFYKCVTILSGPATPSQILKTARQYASTKGTFKMTKQLGEDREIYIPDDPDELVLHITDHAQKLGRERKLEDKGIIDAHTKNMSAELRDKFNWTPIDVHQFNRKIRDPMRKRGGRLVINEGDIMGSSSPYHLSDVFIAMISPRDLDMPNYGKYTTSMYTQGPYNRLRIAKIMKGTYGGAGAVCGYNFEGSVGYFKDIE